MGYTSTAVKRRYNNKTYKPWTAMIRNEIFDKIKPIRAESGLSRAEFLKHLVTTVYGTEF